jgi:hypothetical protein
MASGQPSDCPASTTKAKSAAVSHIEHQQLDTTIEKNARLVGKAVTTFAARINGSRVIPFDLFPTLRVQSVTGDGQGLYFIQEDKNDDAGFSVILAKPLAMGEKYTITMMYSGKEAVINEGGVNYFPIARENWYPNSHLGDRRQLRHDLPYPQRDEGRRHRGPGQRD